MKAVTDYKHNEGALDRLLYQVSVDVGLPSKEAAASFIVDNPVLYTDNMVQAAKQYLIKLMKTESK